MIRALRPLFYAAIGTLVLSCALCGPVLADPPRYDDGAWFYVTGYVCPPYCGTTATGTQATIGRTAACPRWMELTELAIEGVGDRICADTYAAGLSDRLDILVGSVAEAYAITGCHRWDVVTVASFEGQDRLFARFHVPDHHCDNYVWETPPQKANWQ